MSEAAGAEGMTENRLQLWIIDILKLHLLRSALGKRRYVLEDLANAVGPAVFLRKSVHDR